MFQKRGVKMTLKMKMQMKQSIIIDGDGDSSGVQLTDEQFLEFARLSHIKTLYDVEQEQAEPSPRFVQRILANQTIYDQIQQLEDAMKKVFSAQKPDTS